MATISGSSRASKRCACSSASSSGVMNSANSPVPTKSKLSRPLPAGPARQARSARADGEQAPSGRLIRNTDSQPKCCVSQPPATGPKVEEHTNTEAM